MIGLQVVVANVSDMTKIVPFHRVNVELAPIVESEQMCLLTVGNGRIWVRMQSVRIGHGSRIFTCLVQQHEFHAG